MQHASTFNQTDIEREILTPAEEGDKEDLSAEGACKSRTNQGARVEGEKVA